MTSAQRPHHDAAHSRDKGRGLGFAYVRETCQRVRNDPPARTTFEADQGTCLAGWHVGCVSYVCRGAQEDRSVGWSVGWIRDS